MFLLPKFEPHIQDNGFLKADTYLKGCKIQGYQSFHKTEIKLNLGLIAGPHTALF